MSDTNKALSKVVHVYDDIEEEDNHLPNWWLAILFGTIVFGFGYWLVYETTGTLKNPSVVYRDEVAKLVAERKQANPTSEEALLALVKDPAALDEGQKVFAGTCASCHGQKGEGLVGPNLTDAFWLHGATPADVFKAVDTGFADKGMPSWGLPLGPDKTRKVTAFVLSLKGQNLPGKAPQGDAVE